MESVRYVVFGFPYHKRDDEAAEERRLVHERKRVVKVDVGMGAQKVTHCDRVRHAAAALVQRRTQLSMKFKMSVGRRPAGSPAALDCGGGIYGPYGVQDPWCSGLGLRLGGSQI